MITNPPINIVGRMISRAYRLAKLTKSFGSLLMFMAIVAVYVFHLIVSWILKPRRYTPSLITQRIKPKFDMWYASIMSLIDPDPIGGFNRSFLIDLSLKNMQAKKTRTIVTMGGMAIGIAFIVFLVSVGYGLQMVVVSRVARLDELKQADVVPGLSADLALTDETLSKFKHIPYVNEVMPVIAVVGKISYQNSVSDLAVYGVTTQYLKNSAIQPSRGKIFENADRLTTRLDEVGEVAGVTTDIQSRAYDEVLRDIRFTIRPSAWIKVRNSPSIHGSLLGYTKNVAENQSGTEVKGGYYIPEISEDSTIIDAQGNDVGRWVKATVPLWEKKDCVAREDLSCEDGSYVSLLGDSSDQKKALGYFAELSMDIQSTDSPSEVLGVTNSQSTGTLPLIEIASESATINEQQKKVLKLSSDAMRLAVVNRSTLQILNLSEADVINKKVILSFVVVGDLISNPKEKIESAPTEYTIVGVTPDEGIPMVYVPFIDLRSLGVSKYSQIKLVVADTDRLAKVRSSIEASGYGTVSVADTVVQIENLFSSLRLMLGVLGMVALSVAALGMFNTLTVSLLERTREVGLMKAMGMKSNEVKELFLTESMIMGFFGGVIGLIGGICIGKIISMILSIFSVIKGVGVVDISYVPPIFVVTVLLLSVFVGVLTGYFPAKRATKISALNALRYE